MDKGALQELKEKDRTDSILRPSTSAHGATALTRSSSDPQMATLTSSSESPATLQSQGLGRRLSAESVVESPEPEAKNNEDNKQELNIKSPSQDSLENATEEVVTPQQAHKYLDKSASVMSKDSGFETPSEPQQAPQLPRRLSVTSRSGKALARQVVDVMKARHADTNVLPSRDAFNTQSSSSEEKTKKQHKAAKAKEKHKRGKGKRRISRFRERGAELISNISRRVSMRVFDLDHGSDRKDDDDENYVADGSGESDMEDPSHFERGIAPLVALRPHPMPEPEEVDVENAYIDPSSIVSVPKATNRLRELRQHNPVHLSLEESAPKLFHMTKAIIHQRRASVSSAELQDLGKSDSQGEPLESVSEEEPTRPVKKVSDEEAATSDNSERKDRTPPNSPHMKKNKVSDSEVTKQLEGTRTDEEADHKPDLSSSVELTNGDREKTGQAEELGKVNRVSPMSQN